MNRLLHAFCAALLSLPLITATIAEPISINDSAKECIQLPISSSILNIENAVRESAPVVSTQRAEALAPRELTGDLSVSRNIIPSLSEDPPITLIDKQHLKAEPSLESETVLIEQVSYIGFRRQRLRKNSQSRSRATTVRTTPSSRSHSRPSNTKSNIRKAMKSSISRRKLTAQKPSPKIAAAMYRNRLTEHRHQSGLAPQRIEQRSTFNRPSKYTYRPSSVRNKRRYSANTPEIFYLQKGVRRTQLLSLKKQGRASTANHVHAKAANTERVANLSNKNSKLASAKPAANFVPAIKPLQITAINERSHILHIQGTVFPRADLSHEKMATQNMVTSPQKQIDPIQNRFLFLRSNLLLTETRKRRSEQFRLNTLALLPLRTLATLIAPCPVATALTIAPIFESLFDVKRLKVQIADERSKRLELAQNRNLSRWKARNRRSMRMKIAKNALNTAKKMNTVGYCYRGVTLALRPLGINLTGMAAYMAKEQLDTDPRFQQVSIGEIAELHPGDVLVHGPTRSHPYGHIGVYLGNENEASDHVQKVFLKGPYSGLSVFRYEPTNRDAYSALGLPADEKSAS